MGYQRGIGSRSSGRGRGIPRHEKAKAKKQKHRPNVAYAPEEDQSAASGDVVGKTLNGLSNLGKQVFAISPFSEHFGRWLVDVRVVLSEFESNRAVSVDDQFLKERSQILNDVEVELEGRRNSEAAAEKAARDLAINRVLLEKMEKEYSVEERKLKGRKDGEIKRLGSKVDGLKGEVERIGQMKTGIFRGLSKKAKAQKEEEAMHKLKEAEKELSLAEQDFAAQEEKFRAEHEKRKQPITAQIEAEQKEAEEADIDQSIKVRQRACEALIIAVNSFVERNGSSGHASPES